MKYRRIYRVCLAFLVSSACIAPATFGQSSVASRKGRWDRQFEANRDKYDTNNNDVMESNEVEKLKEDLIKIFTDPTDPLGNIIPEAKEFLDTRNAFAGMDGLMSFEEANEFDKELRRRLDPGVRVKLDKGRIWVPGLLIPDGSGESLIGSPYVYSYGWGGVAVARVSADSEGMAAEAHGILDQEWTTKRVENVPDSPTFQSVMVGKGVVLAAAIGPAPTTQADATATLSSSGEGAPATVEHAFASIPPVMANDPPIASKPVVRLTPKTHVPSVNDFSYSISGSAHATAATIAGGNGVHYAGALSRLYFTLKPNGSEMDDSTPKKNTIPSPEK